MPGPGGTKRAPSAPPARRATSAELVVAQDAMANPLIPRTHSIRQSKLPRRTYQAALRRMYGWEWIRDRFVPRPSLTGLPTIVFWLARTAAESRSQVIEAIRRSTGLAHCWAFAHTVFSVSFVKAPSSLESLLARLREGGLCSEVRVLAVDGTDSGVSIYFDFEGEWTRYGGLAGAVSYPHRLREQVPIDASGERTRPSPRVLRTTMEMVSRPLNRDRSPSVVPEGRARWYLRFAERAMIRQGWVEPRTFLNPLAVARTLTDFAGGITFVHGELRPGARSDSLERELLERARVHPFLLASDERSVLLGFLSAGPMTRLAPAPVPNEPVRGVIERHLDPFAVIREDLNSGEPIVVHRYSSAFGTSQRIGR